jgi:ATP-dependent Clp protease, protease subunit
MNKSIRAKVAYFGFTGVIEPGNVKGIAAAFNSALNSGCSEIHFCMNSPGGYVGDGVYLYNHILALPIKVTTHNTGTVGSIATAVFAAGEERYCSAHGMFMIHPSAIGPFSEALMSSRLNSALEGALADDERTESILRERTNIPARLLKDRRLKDVHISPQEALKFGLVHGVREFALPQGCEIFQI